MGDKTKEPRFNFRVSQELHDAVSEKLKKTNGTATKYITDLIERDLSGQLEVSPANPIGDLIERMVPILKPRYQAAIDRTRDGLDPREDELLINLLAQSLKILHDPDRSDMTIITEGELEAALLEVFNYNEKKPLTPLIIQDIADKHIREAKKREYLGSTAHVPGYTRKDADEFLSVAEESTAYSDSPDPEADAAFQKELSKSSKDKHA